MKTPWRLFCVPFCSQISCAVSVFSQHCPKRNTQDVHKNDGGFVMENIIFGIMVLIAVGAGIVTCIYEVGGSSRANVSEQSDAGSDTKNSK